MKTVIVALAILLAATAAARPAFARRHDDFELKELREERAEHQEEKAAIQEERVEEKEKEQAHARKPHPQERHSHSTTDDGGGDLDGD